MTWRIGPQFSPSFYEQGVTIGTCACCERECDIDYLEGPDQNLCPDCLHDAKQCMVCCEWRMCNADGYCEECDFQPVVS